MDPAFFLPAVATISGKQHKKTAGGGPAAEIRCRMDPVHPGIQVPSRLVTTCWDEVQNARVSSASHQLR